MYETAVILGISITAAILATFVLIILDEFVDYDDE